MTVVDASDGECSAVGASMKAVRLCEKFEKPKLDRAALVSKTRFLEFAQFDDCRMFDFLKNFEINNSEKANFFNIISNKLQNIIFESIHQIIFHWQ